MSQLRISLPFLLLLIPGVVSTTKLTITNNCGYTMWPAISSTGGATINLTGFALQQGDSRTLIAPSSWNGRVWGRTRCAENSTGTFSCATGDCGSGKVECGGRYGSTATLSELSLDLNDEQDFYDVSLVDGFNLPMFVTPQGGSGNCSTAGCAVDLNAECPSDLRVTGDGGDTVACKGACAALQLPQYCCTANVSKCESTSVSQFFKSACPKAYSYAMDDASSTFTCSSPADYLITFCPSPASPAPPPASPAPSPTTPDTLGHKRSSHKQRQAGIIAGSIVSVIAILVLMIWMLLLRRRKNIRKAALAQMVGDLKDGIELPIFDLTTITYATNNFSSSNKLGEGGFGPVYKGTLTDGREIAVKKLSKSSHQGFNEFKTEVKLIAKLQHRNLVRLLGCCIHEDEKMLIYEYMANKSLDFYIFDKTRTMLDWSKRRNIIVGIARGLLYLHQDSRLRIIHRDLKASNILLDSDMNAKISDFGLARAFGADQSQANTNKVVGTYGYMAPEYVVDGLFSVKSDVFSFGVLVLEIINGGKNRGFQHPDHDLNLLGHAWMLWTGGTPLQLMDECLVDSFQPFEVTRCIHVALLCVQLRPEYRPTMATVVMMLNGEGSLPEPKQPGYFMARNPSEPDTKQSYSANGATITELEAR